MSDDLISRSALLKALEEKVYPEKYGEKCNTLDVINGVLQVIDEQPTAFDVDKVMEQFEKEIKEHGKVHSLARFEWLAALEMVKVALNIDGGME